MLLELPTPPPHYHRRRPANSSRSSSPSSQHLPPPGDHRLSGSGSRIPLGADSGSNTEPDAGLVFHRGQRAALHSKPSGSRNGEISVFRSRVAPAQRSAVLSPHASFRRLCCDDADAQFVVAAVRNVKLALTELAIDQIDVSTTFSFTTLVTGAFPEDAP
ncbi:unnamed protein product [Linum trigynum]|uniref:Uncharacterized protein n=1 Tax=Linum trigynum TaxID=586398 RepID=A0AAV2GKQ4_9ROSI